MKTYLNIFLIIIMTLPAIAQNNFLQNQLKFERVKQAYDEKWNNLKNDLVAKGCSDSYELCINVYKSEGKLEVWLKKQMKLNLVFLKPMIFVNIRGI